MKRPYLKTLWESVCRIAAPKRIVLHATSQEEAEESAKRLPGVDTVVVPNGVEIPERISLRNARNSCRFAYLGRIHPKKGIENLLEAYKIVEGQLPAPSSLVIGGDGDPSYVQTIKHRIQQLCLDGSVRMVRHVTDEAKREFFESADVLIAPSFTE